MNIYDFVLKSRSFRRFREEHEINREILTELIQLARISASGANKQPLKYKLVHEKQECARVFPYTNWAGYLKNWPGPDEGERPSAYIIIVGDTGVSSSFGVDHGIVAQNILLGAVEAGLGGCMIGSIRKDGLRKEFNIPYKYEILLIVALGKPNEEVVIEEVKENDIKYWRDDKGIHHVPKRSLDELIIEFE
jgi:nitroreductase